MAINKNLSQPMAICYIALGTNLGNRVQNLRLTLGQLPPQLAVLNTSRLYETAAAYVEDQPNFLNMAIMGQTALSPVDLLAYLKQIEVEMGRQTNYRYGPRVIDLDILFYDDLVMETPSLQIPHPRLTERAFVLYPLRDIAPNLAHPITGETVHELAAALPNDNQNNNDEAGILRVMSWPPNQN